jgi:aspartyl-tRNA(Asn)/glutamyl-tRNA(Gln) amidotransferase subunit A
MLLDLKHSSKALLKAKMTLLDLTLTQAADAVAHGEITAEALASAALDRLEQVGKPLNAVIALDRDSALESARNCDLSRAKGHRCGALHGVPLAHKDLFYRQGRVSTYGSPIRARFVPDVTARALSRLDAAGALDIATLALSEFAFSPTGFNQTYGHGRNPWNRDYIAGGSSSGSAIATAGRMVFGAMGTDTGGSIRHPAAACGVVGLKPTLGRVSRFGVGPLSTTLDCVGPLARTARDCARILSVIAGHDPADPACSAVAVPDYESALDGSLQGLRIAVPRALYDAQIDPEVTALLAASLDVLRGRGAQIIDCAAPDLEVANALGQAAMAVEAAAVHRPWLATRRDDYAEVVRSRIEPGLFVPSVQYLDALRVRRRVLQDYMKTVFADADLVHMPMFCIAVPTIAQTTESTAQSIGTTLAALTRFTRSLNFLGLPAITVPAGFTDNGLPAAFQLVGKPFAEASLLRGADAYQQDTHWHLRAPPL